MEKENIRDTHVLN